jgi:GNAT superfamily N-acetyltransferase
LEWRRPGFTLTTERDRVDVAAVHAFLTRTYWAEGVPLEVVRRSIEHSLNFSVWRDAEAGAPAAHVGFARVVTDYATFAYVGDVFVLEPWRGRGLSRWMMECMVAHPELQGFRRWALLTRDAHGLYAQHGFTPLARPDRWMERWAPDVYRAPPGPRPGK